MKSMEINMDKEPSKTADFLRVERKYQIQIFPDLNVIGLNVLARFCICLVDRRFTIFVVVGLKVRLMGNGVVCLET